MNRNKRAVLVGLALGDGYVQVRKRLNRGKYPYTASSINISHSPQQRAYCEWKAKRLSWALDGRKVNVHRYDGVGPGKRYSEYRIGVSHTYFKQIRGWLYPGGKKTITPRILEMLSPEAIAIWYMDDGHARRNVSSDGFVSSVASEIATMCSEEEVEAIQHYFMMTYGIEFRKRYDKRFSSDKAYYIQVNTAMSKEFIGLVGPYIPECMAYKMAHVATCISQERQTPVGRCAECDTDIYDNRRKGLCIRCYSRQYEKRR